MFAVTHGKSFQPGETFVEAVESVYGFSQELTSLRTATKSRQVLQDARWQRALDTALRNDVTSYVLDRSNMPGELASAEHAGGGEPGARPYLRAYLQEMNDMASLAEETGGSMVRDPELASAATRAYRREQARWSLGFYPETLIRRDGLGRIRVKVDPRQLGYERVDTGSEDKPGIVQADLTVHVSVQTLAGETLAEAFHTFSHEYDLPVWQAGREKPLVLPGRLIGEPGRYRVIAKIRNYRLGKGGRVLSEVELAP